MKPWMILAVIGCTWTTGIARTETCLPLIRELTGYAQRGVMERCAPDFNAIYAHVTEVRADGRYVSSAEGWLPYKQLSGCKVGKPCFPHLWGDLRQQFSDRKSYVYKEMRCPSGQSCMGYWQNFTLAKTDVLGVRIKPDDKVELSLKTWNNDSFIVDVTCAGRVMYGLKNNKTLWTLSFDKGIYKNPCY